MIALDTNVLARFYIEPEDVEAEKQRPIAAWLMHESNSLFVSVSVVLELEWVLRGGYQFDRDAIKNTLTHLFHLPNVTVENHDLMLTALENYARGLDFADAIHVATAARCAAFTTFDRRFVKSGQRLGLKPSVTDAQIKK